MVELSMEPDEEPDDEPVLEPEMRPQTVLELQPEMDPSPQPDLEPADELPEDPLDGTSMIINENVPEGKLFSDDKPSTQKSVIINEESNYKSFAEQLNNLDISHFSDEKKAPDLSSMRMVFGSEATIREHCEKAIEMGPIDEPLLSEDAFNRRSFQDFSLKKFTELIQDDKLPNLYQQKTYREHVPEPLAPALPPTLNKKQKDLELDSLGASYMKRLSDQKSSHHDDQSQAPHFDVFEPLISSKED